MSLLSPAFRSAREDFRQARQQAALQSIVARLRGQSVKLLAYDEVVKMLRPTGRSDRGPRDIPLDAIVGSVGRYTDFTRTFLPLKDSDEQRWAKVKVAVDEQDLDALPPIEVYQIGKAYFVKDGNHRVSIARQKGYAYIHALVTEVRTRVPLTPDIQPDDLIIKAEQAAFLDYTRLDEHRPGADLSVSMPGQYPKLEDHIEAHRYLQEIEQGRDLPFKDAVCTWYDDVYLPVVRAIREQGILRYFPERTEADLYLWLSDHRLALQREVGWRIEPEAAAEKLAAHIKRLPERAARDVLDAGQIDVKRSRHTTGQWRREKIVDRYSDRLFADILVPLTGKPGGWHALDQALQVARREEAHVYGLHIVASESDTRNPEAQTIRGEFQRCCKTMGVAGQIGIEIGDVAHQICARAIMADLVILDLDHPPASHPVARLGSRFMTIMRQAARPVLAVPRSASPLTRALLAYDGSDKAREALFVAAYLAERLKIPLVVLSVMAVGRIPQAALDYAHRYLEMHEAEATFVRSEGSVAEAILKTAREHAADLLIMGGYGARPIRQVVLGGSVERVLRESEWPVMICR